MTLTLYFRLIIAILFQRSTQLDYSTTFFLCPSVYAKDGFHCSLQINNGNYCSSENGYRNFGVTWQEVEFGFTNIHEELMVEFAETPNDTTETVGRIPINVMEEVFKKHGGIDWEKTLSIENISKIIRKD